MMKSHYFLAVSLPETVKDALEAWRQQHQKELPFQSWVHHDDYHITLVFLGEVSSLLLSRIQEEMQQLSINRRFSITVQGIGAFGLAERPRVLWAGITHPPELFALQKQVYNFCEALGFSLETRPYRPHITLARRWRGEYPLTDLQQRKNHELSFSVEKITLYKSHLQRTPKYEEIFSILLSES
ncbi:RNA 2',3'-cyclic phosphodiesterase [Ectobacillus funiculus]